MTIPEACIKVEDVAAFLLPRHAASIAHLLQSRYFSNAAGSGLITNLEPGVRNRMYCLLHPEDYSSNVGGTNKEEEERRRKGRRGRQRRRKEEEEEGHSDDEIEANVGSEEGDTSGSFMLLPLNFSEKSPGNEVSFNSGLKLLVLNFI